MCLHNAYVAWSLIENALLVIETVVKVLDHEQQEKSSCWYKSNIRIFQSSASKGQQTRTAEFARRKCANLGEKCNERARKYIKFREQYNAAPTLLENVTAVSEERATTDSSIGLEENAIDSPIRGRVDRASATETVDSGSIPGRVIPKTIKIGIHSFTV